MVFRHFNSIVIRKFSFIFDVLANILLLKLPFFDNSWNHCLTSSNSKNCFGIFIDFFCPNFFWIVMGRCYFLIIFCLCLLHRSLISNRMSIIYRSFLHAEEGERTDIIILLTSLWLFFFRTVCLKLLVKLRVLLLFIVIFQSLGICLYKLLFIEFFVESLRLF